MKDAEYTEYVCRVRKFPFRPIQYFGVKLFPPSLCGSVRRPVVLLRTWNPSVKNDSALERSSSVFKRSAAASQLSQGSPPTHRRCVVLNGRGIKPQLYRRTFSQAPRTLGWRKASGWWRLDQHNKLHGCKWVEIGVMWGWQTRLLSPGDGLTPKNTHMRAHISESGSPAGLCGCVADACSGRLLFTWSSCLF